VFYAKITSSDSLIQPFKYTIKVGNDYVINASEAKIFEYMNKEFPIHKLATINDDSIQIGGNNKKPTLINFWHVHCPPCVAEIPVLNKLKEKYSDKVNFVSITFETKNDVEEFLKKKEFNFKHIVNADDYVKKIGIESYPQNVFIDKQGILRYIEGGIPFVNYEKKEIGDGKEFEKIIKELL
jgi:thiol-disulfide isomerase/thioredoxin